MAIAAVRVQVPLRVLKYAEVAQLVEHNLAKVRVAGSSPVFRSASISPTVLRDCGAFYFYRLFPKIEYDRQRSGRHPVPDLLPIVFPLVIIGTMIARE